MVCALPVEGAEESGERDDSGHVSTVREEIVKLLT